MDQDMAGGAGPGAANQLNQEALTGAFEKLKGQGNDELQGMMDNMQITVMGGNNEEEKSEASGNDSEESDADNEDSHF